MELPFGCTEDILLFLPVKDHSSLAAVSRGLYDWLQSSTHRWAVLLADFARRMENNWAREQACLDCCSEDTEDEEWTEDEFTDDEEPQLSWSGKEGLWGGFTTEGDTENTVHGLFQKRSNYFKRNWKGPGTPLDVKSIVLAAVQLNGDVLRYCETLRTDKEVAVAAVRENFQMLDVVSAQNRQDREVVLAAAQSRGCGLACLPPEFRRDPEVVRTAMSRCIKEMPYYQGKRAVAAALLETGEVVDCVVGAGELVLVVVETLPTPKGNELSLCLKLSTKFRAAFHELEGEITGFNLYASCAR